MPFHHQKYVYNYIQHDSCHETVPTSTTAIAESASQQVFFGKLHVIWRSIEMNRKNKIILGISIGILAGIGITYGAGTYYYSQHFLYGTSINGKDVSNMSISEAEQAITNISDLKLSVAQRGQIVDKIYLDEIGYQAAAPKDGCAKLVKEQNFYAWPMSFFKEKKDIELQMDVSYDQKMLDEAVNSLYCLSNEKRTAPKDAYIDHQDGTYVIVPEEKGTAANAEKTHAVVKDALAKENFSIDLEHADVYPSATVTKDDPDLKDELDLLHSFGDMVLTIDFNGASEELKGDNLAALLKRTPDGTPAVDIQKVRAYTEEMEEKYNTIYTQRNFKDHNGNIIQVGGYGTDTYGWMMNVPSTANAITNALNEKTTTTISAFWDVSAFQREGANGDIGNTYIEISIAAQHLWFYQECQMIYETDIVTGMPSHNQNTPIGVFRVWSKDRNATLKGTAWDGKKWESPVAYWMPFTWTGVGLHDAPWQSAFGGELYYSRGSHGCVNLPNDAAAFIFNNAPINVPVIVY